MTLTELIDLRADIVRRLGEADTRPWKNGVRGVFGGPTPGSIRDELFAFDDAHPEVKAELKRVRGLEYKGK
jgi:hypothetical protein